MEILAVLVLIISSIGDSLYWEGDYFNAITEYKRESFLAENDNGLLLRKIALCYYRRGLFDEASAYYSDLFYQSDSNNLRVLFALSLLRSRKFEEAQVLLSDDTTLIGALLRSISFGLDVKYGYAMRILDSLGVSHPKYISENMVVWASRIIPGSGLLYFGQIPLFLGTLTLTGAFGYLFYHYIKNRLYIEAILSAYPLIERFYRGGIWNTKTQHRLYYSNYFKELLKKIETQILLEEEKLLFPYR